MPGPRYWSDDHLDELSNSVIDLVNAGDIDAAMEICGELKEMFPNMPDVAMQQAEVHKAQNEYTEAAGELTDGCGGRYALR